MGLTKKLAQDLYQIQCLSESDQKQLKTLIIDFMAASCAGYKQNRVFNSAVENIRYSQGGAEESYVLFQKKKYPACLAAFMNSIYGHGAELDDGNKKAAGHAGAHIIPAVFALADKLESNNCDVLVALATGYEAYIRISSAAQPGLVNRGFHSTGVVGTIACAAACSRLYNMDVQGIEDAIALATTMTGGLLSYGDSRPAIKPLNPGKAAENGLFAAMLANAGIQGPTEALEGRNGWFHAVTDQVHEEFLRKSEALLIHDCYLKLYPSCRHTHCVIDAAVSLFKRVKIDEIDKVNIYIYPSAIKLAGIKIPKNLDETKFSIQYTFAYAMLNGFYRVTDIDKESVEWLTPEIIDLINKTNLIPDQDMEDRSKGIRGAHVEVLLKCGGSVTETVLVPKGDPEKPLSRKEVIEKFSVCAQGQIADNIVEAIVGKILAIEGNNKFKNPMNMTGVEG